MQIMEEASSIHRRSQIKKSQIDIQYQRINQKNRHIMGAAASLNEDDSILTYLSTRLIYPVAADDTPP